MKETIEQIAQQDGRYPPEALRFVYEGLGYTVRHFAEESTSEVGETQLRHVSGRELCEGLRKMALKRWGRMALAVLENWNIRTTRDFGEIVYLMISHQWMSSQAGDTIEDFDDIYDFKTVFEDQFEFQVETEYK